MFWADDDRGVAWSTKTVLDSIQRVAGKGVVGVAREGQAPNGQPVG